MLLITKQIVVFSNWGLSAIAHNDVFQLSGRYKVIFDIKLFSCTQQSKKLVIYCFHISDLRMTRSSKKLNEE